MNLKTLSGSLRLKLVKLSIKLMSSIGIQIVGTDLQYT